MYETSWETYKWFSHPQCYFFRLPYSDTWNLEAFFCFVRKGDKIRTWRKRTLRAGENYRKTSEVMSKDKKIDFMNIDILPCHRNDRSRDIAGMAPAQPHCVVAFLGNGTWIPTYLLFYLTTYLTTYLPSYLPSYLPTYLPTFLPTFLPSYLPTFLPTFLPSYLPTYLPTYLPSFLPTYLPIFLQTYLPTYLPSFLPTYLPTYLEISKDENAEK